MEIYCINPNSFGKIFSTLAPIQDAEIKSLLKRAEEIKDNPDKYLES